MISNDSRPISTSGRANILIDGNCVAARSYFGVSYGKPEFNEGLFIKAVMSSLLCIIEDTIAYGTNYLLCIDSKSWRYDVYPDYKKKDTEKPGGDEMYKQYKEAWNNIAIEIKQNLPFIVLKKDRFEGDDLVAYHALVSSPNGAVIVSQDKDLVQLLKIPNTKYWNFATRTFVEPTDLDYLLHELICMGDTSDAIPSIVPRNENGKKIFPFGEVNIKENYNIGCEMNISRVFIELKMKPNKQNLVKMTAEQFEELKKNYQRNKTLIDLMEAPWFKNTETLGWNMNKVCDINKVREFFNAFAPSCYDSKTELLMGRMMEA